MDSLKRILRTLAVFFVVIAVACILVSLTNGAIVRAPLGYWAPLFSGAPLLLIGLSFLIVQPILRPRWTELLRNLLLATAFLLWGIVQLMTQNVLSRKLGDVVIALYVIDLAWMILAGLNSAGTIQPNSPNCDSFEK